MASNIPIKYFTKRSFWSIEGTLKSIATLGGRDLKVQTDMKNISSFEDQNYETKF